MLSEVGGVTAASTMVIVAMHGQLMLSVYSGTGNTWENMHLLK